MVLNFTVALDVLSTSDYSCVFHKLSTPSTLREECMFKKGTFTLPRIFSLRQESIKQAEKERRVKYKKQDDEREVIRSALREKVIGALINNH